METICAWKLILLGIEIDIAWYRNFGKDACSEIWLDNTCLSWVRKTLTLQYMCILGWSKLVL